MSCPRNGSLRSQLKDLNGQVSALEDLKDQAATDAETLSHLRAELRAKRPLPSYVGRPQLCGPRGAQAFHASTGSGPEARRCQFGARGHWGARSGGVLAPPLMVGEPVEECSAGALSRDPRHAHNRETQEVVVRAESAGRLAWALPRVSLAPRSAVGTMEARWDSHEACDGRATSVDYPGGSGVQDMAARWSFWGLHMTDGRRSAGRRWASDVSP
jgi:hypothetical protein